MKRALSSSVLLGAIVAGCAAGSEEPPPDGGEDAITSDAALDDVSDAGLAQDSGSSEEDSSAGDPPPWDATSGIGDSGSPASSKDAGGDAGFEDALSGTDSAANDDGTTPESEDAGGPGDAEIVDDDAGAIDIAPTGVGYTWQSMTSALADTGRLAALAVNDGSFSTQVDIDSNSGDNAGAWEAAGVVFSGDLTVTAVTFVQGTTSTSGDGWFEANFGLQFSTDTTTWSAAGWSVNPAYSYSSAVSGKTYVFSGPALSGVRGIRIVGQVNTVGDSWWAAVNEVMVFGH